MLRKLLKHELRATSRWMLPMFLLVLLTSVLMRSFGQRLIEMDNGVLNAIGGLLIMLFLFSVAGMCMVAYVLMIYRFWKNLLSDEGYVTMTLPVSVHQHICSKLLVTAMWYVISALVLLAAVFIMSFDIDGIEVSLGEMLGMLADLQLDWGRWQTVLTVIEVLIILLIAALTGSLLIWTAMAIGHSFANRKALFSVLVYFAVETAMQVLSGIGSIFLPLEILDGLPHTAVLALAILAELAVAAAFYFVTAYFLEKRLNLE